MTGLRPSTFPGDRQAGAEANLVRRLHWLPLAWALVWTIILGVAFFAQPWPYMDVAKALRDAATSGWGEYFRNAFLRDVEYRPLFTLSVKAAYGVAGLRLWIYQALVLVQLAAVLALLIWLFRAGGWRRGVAASIAISCVLGLHTSRILFGFWPLNFASLIVIAILGAIALALDARARSLDWVFFPLTLIALLSLEWGVILVPLAVVLLWARAPGVSARSVAAALAGIAVYLAIRLGLGRMDAPGGIYTGSGLGFSDVSPEALRNIFERAPVLFWLYNVCANLLTVLVSEPRAGVYRFISSLLAGDTPHWQWLHVGSSVLTTAVIAFAVVMFRPMAARDRVLGASGLVLIACSSTLGFLYARDRIGLPAGIGYALLLYVALAALLERGPRRAWQRVLVLGVVGVIAAAWTVRSGETFFQLRDAAWDSHLEWTDRYDQLGGAAQPQTGTLLALRSAALGSTPDDPRGDPAWTYMLFERRFTPGAVRSHGTPDHRADTVVRPLSPPFDIRWTPAVTEAERPRFEAELGLTDPQRVERDPRGQTFTYRLRQPTRERVRDIVIHPAVEDTARVDAVRFQIED